jgi:pimeloyl-ACP methyl ester carboxylesterase
MTNVLGVTRYLLGRFHRDKLYLVAHSGGTIGATLAVQDQPQLFAAYVGVGQAADLTTSDRTEYQDVLGWARGKGDAKLVAQLTALGPPPYGTVYDYEPMLSHEKDVYGSDSSGALLDNLGAPEDSLLDRVHVVTGFLDAFDAYYPTLRDVDFRTQVPQLSVPVYFVAGDHEVPARTRDLKAWFQVLRAPHKEIVTLRDAGHRSMFQQPAAFVDVMRRVLTETR